MLAFELPALLARHMELHFPLVIQLALFVDNNHFFRRGSGHVILRGLRHLRVRKFHSFLNEWH